MLILAIGGKGVIFVIANIIPKDTADIIRAWEDEDLEQSRKLYYMLLPLNQAIFYKKSPAPVKNSLALMGKIGERIRLLLPSLSESNLERLKKLLNNYGANFKMFKACSSKPRNPWPFSVMKINGL